MIALAGAALGSGCEQPTGVVISVQEAEDSKQLWLAVGEPIKADGVEEVRFLQGEGTGTIDHPPPFSDGFEIFLDRDELMAQSKIALVLDSTVGEGASLEILRDSYVLKPEAGALTEVKLTPSKIGSGQWVCAGRPGSNTQPGFTVALYGGDLDCDRDGWHVGDDPDDADPLQAGMPAWSLGREPGRCLLKLGGEILRDIPAGQCPVTCLIENESELENCLQDTLMVRCQIEEKVGETRGSFTVEELFGAPLGIPDWELVKLRPAGARAYFAPSIRSPSEWSVTFELGDAKFGWFLLTDRTDSTISRLIRIEAKIGATGECE